MSENKFNIGDIVWICRGNDRGCPAKIVKLYLSGRIAMYEITISTEFGIKTMYRMESNLKSSLKDKSKMKTDLLRYLENE